MKKNDKIANLIIEVKKAIIKRYESLNEIDFAKLGMLRPIKKNYRFVLGRWPEYSKGEWLLYINSDRSGYIRYDPKKKIDFSSIDENVKSWLNLTSRPATFVVSETEKPYWMVIDETLVFDGVPREP